MTFHSIHEEKIFELEKTSKQGLSSSEAAARLLKNGKNKLEEGKKKTVIGRFLEQMTDPMVIVLIIAAVISGVFGETVDMAVILTVVVLNATLGVIQEGKAEKAIEALQKMASPFSKVRRDGRVLRIHSEEITVGDIVLLEAGDAVPADLRLTESASLKIEEASLTGESVPAEKQAKTVVAEDAALGDRVNMAYMGTNVVYGRGEGIVVSSGMGTEMGKIAGILTGTLEEKTPLQKKLSDLSKVLSIGVLAISAFIFLFGVVQNGGFQGPSMLEMFLTAVSLAVAAIPEGLVAVVTIVLSIGVTHMSRRNAIIRRLTAVETLGCTQIICSDKTGTLTQNKMTVVDTSGDEKQLILSMMLCNDAQVADDGVIGEPTERALVEYALKEGYNKNETESVMPRVLEAPFDSERKMMSTIHTTKDGFVQYTKGAPDEILKHCSRILVNSEELPLTDGFRQQILSENRRMSGNALRVLGSAMRSYAELPQGSVLVLEREMTFIGLMGMIDPVRPEAKLAIEKCRAAGIRPIMITGDHIDTAVAIAKELGIISDENQTITGIELNKIPDEEFEAEKYSVYARVQPDHKVRIVTAWKRKGKITAMTGDGVNDAPALKSADIGVGMGITGTDVSKNVSDMVLGDDNFATIVDAVEEGRRIFDNIRKAIQFLLASNLSEVVALFIATVMNFRLLMPIHILWINLVTDSLPAIALGMERAEANVMRRPPRNPSEGIFAGGVGTSVLYQGILIAVLTILSYFMGSAQSQITGMTMAFFTLSMCELFHSFNMRSQKASIFVLKKQNRTLWAAFFLCSLLTFMVVYTPGLNTVFKLAALDMKHSALALGLALSIIPAVELIKLIIRIAEHRRYGKN